MALWDTTLSAVEVAQTTGIDVEKSPYEFKPGPYSSHTLALQMLPEKGEGRYVLDVGCGPGYMSELLAARGYSVIGIEHSEAMPQAASANVKYLEADLDRGLPHLNHTFDFVLCLDVLEHLREPVKLLREIARILSPEGRLVASLPNSGNVYFRLNVLFGRFPAHDRGLFDRTHLHFYTWAGWVELLASGGFRIQRVQPSSVPAGPALKRSEDSGLVIALETVWYWLSCLWKKLFAYQFIVTAIPRRRS
jgi:SAM-dependent methyltransferase